MQAKYRTHAKHTWKWRTCNWSDKQKESSKIVKEKESGVPVRLLCMGQHCIMKSSLECSVLSWYKRQRNSPTCFLSNSYIYNLLNYCHFSKQITNREPTFLASQQLLHCTSRYLKRFTNFVYLFICIEYWTDYHTVVQYAMRAATIVVETRYMKILGLPVRQSTRDDVTLLDEQRGQRKRVSLKTCAPCG